MRTAHRLGLPHPRYLTTVAQRTVVMWVLARLLLFAVMFVLSGPRAALHQPTLGIPALLVWIDRRHFHEELLPANLAAAEGWFWLLTLSIALGLDLLAGLVLQMDLLSILTRIGA